MPSIFFPICSVINMSLGDIETIVSCNQSRVTHWDLSLGKFNSELKYSSDSLYIGFHFQSLTILWCLMKYSQRSLTLKRLFSNFYVFGSTWYLSIYLAEFSHYPQSASLMPPQWEYCSHVSPGKNFWKFSFSPVSQAVPTGVLRQGVLIAQIWKLPKENTQCFHCLFIRENEQRCMKIWCSFHEPRIHCKVWNLISFGLNPQEHNKTDFS